MRTLNILNLAVVALQSAVVHGLELTTEPTPGWLAGRNADYVSPDYQSSNTATTIAVGVVISTVALAPVAFGLWIYCYKKAHSNNCCYGHCCGPFNCHSEQISVAPQPPIP